MKSLSRVGLGLVLAGVCFSLVYAGGLPKKEEASQPQEKTQAVIEEVDVIEVQETTIITEEETTWIGAESVWSLRNKMPRTKVYARLEPSEDRYYLIGISKIDLKGSNPYKRRDRRNVQYLEYDVQIASKYLDNNLTLRGGIINSGLGIGIDYMLPDEKTSITVEGHSAVYSSPFFLRANLSYKILEDKDYYLIAGVEDMLDKPSVIAGVKIEFGLTR